MALDPVTTDHLPIFIYRNLRESHQRRWALVSFAFSRKGNVVGKGRLKMFRKVDPFTVLNGDGCPFNLLGSNICDILPGTWRT
jgi:hypothetical protein